MPIRGLLVYGVSKAGLERLTTGVAEELRARTASPSTASGSTCRIASEGFVYNAPELDKSDWEPTEVGAEGALWMLAQPATVHRAGPRHHRPPARHGVATEPCRALSLPGRDARARREAGILLPLFALRGARDWGIGEIGDAAGRSARWLAAAGHRLLQLLPDPRDVARRAEPVRGAHRVRASTRSTCRSTAVEDFVAAGGEGALPAADRDALAAARRAPRDRLRRASGALKRAALEIAFARFRRTASGSRDSARAASPRVRESDAAGWLDEYALFRGAPRAHGGRPWTRRGSRRLRDRDRGSARAARRARPATALVFQEYVQWLAAEQWADGAPRRRAAGVRLEGDLPFMVSGRTAPTSGRGRTSSGSTRRSARRPTPSTPTGQDWGLPVCRLGGDGRQRLRLAARARAARDRGALRRRPARPRRRLLPACT